MLIELDAFFLAGALLLYCLFGGADFGAGILEGFAASEDEKQVIHEAITPVWEANHVWLILAVVIVFSAFPKVFSQVSITFHIPLTVMLVGIIGRGCALTFRHYDPEATQGNYYYGLIFKVSSLLAPFCLGLVAGGVFLGRVDPATLSFGDLYVWPWLNLFSVSLGIFICFLFSFLAAVYLTCETEKSNLVGSFKKKAVVANICCVVAGLLVFVSAEIDGFHLIHLFLNSPVSLISMILATLILWPLMVCIKRENKNVSRVLAALQMICVLTGWFGLMYPTFLFFKDPALSLTIFNCAAPVDVLKAILIALIVGVLLILPSLGFLLKTFKTKSGLL